MMYGSSSMSSLNYSYSNMKNDDWDPEASRASLAGYADSLEQEANAAAAWEELHESMRIKRQEKEKKEELARQALKEEQEEIERQKLLKLEQQKAQEEAQLQKLIQEDPEIPPWHRESAAHHTKPAWLLDILVAVAKKEEHEHDDMYAIYRQPHLLPQRPELLVIQKAAKEVQENPDKMFKSPQQLPLKKEAALIRIGKAQPVASTTLLLETIKQEPPTPVKEEFYYEEIEEEIIEIHEEIIEEEIHEEEEDFIDQLLSDDEEEEIVEEHEEESLEENVHEEEAFIEQLLSDDEEEEIVEEHEEELLEENELEEEAFIEQLLSDDEEERFLEEEIHKEQEVQPEQPNINANDSTADREEKPVEEEAVNKVSSNQKMVSVGKLSKESPATENRNTVTTSTQPKQQKRATPDKKQQAEQPRKVVLRKVAPKSLNQPTINSKEPAATQQAPWKVKLKSTTKATKPLQDNSGEDKVEISKPSFPFTKEDLKTSKPVAKLQQRDVLQKPAFQVSPRSLKTNSVADRIAQKPILKTLQAPVTGDDCVVMKKLLNHRKEAPVVSHQPIWAQRDKILRSSKTNLLEEETEKKPQATLTALAAPPRKTKEVNTTEIELDNEKEEDSGYAVPWKRPQPRISTEDLNSSLVKEKLQRKTIIRKPSFTVSKEELKSNVVKEKLQQRPVIQRPSYLASKEELKSNVVKEKLKSKPDIRGRKAVASSADMLQKKNSLKTTPSAQSSKPAWMLKTMELQQSLRSLDCSSRTLDCNEDTEKPKPNEAPWQHVKLKSVNQ